MSLLASLERRRPTQVVRVEASGSERIVTQTLDIDSCTFLHREIFLTTNSPAIRRA